MSTAQWISSGAAASALGVSGVTAFLTWRWRVADRAVADVTVYFHRNSEKAKVLSPDGTVERIGYNLVLWNRGPAEATNLTFVMVDASGDALSLVDLNEGELPILRLPSGAKYPVPWMLDRLERRRAYRCTLSWHDKRGKHEVTIPLRRGEYLP